MSRLIKKFVAVLLAMWLPLFSGNVLAVSIAMQHSGGNCHDIIAQQDEHYSHHASTAHQHMHHDQVAANPDQSGSPDQQQSSCESSGLCHLACCGYLACSALLPIAEQQADCAVTPYSDSFHTLTLQPLDPPPLARV